MTAAPQPDDSAYDDIFHKAVTSTLHTMESNRDAAHAAYNKAVDEAIGSGAVVVTGQEVKRYARDYNWMRLNNKAGLATKRIMKEMASGQLTLVEVESLLDTVVTAGHDRRTTLRHLNERDLDRMTDERRDNFDKQKASWEDWEGNISVVFRGWLRAHGNMPAAIAAGDVAKPDSDAAGESA